MSNNPLRDLLALMEGMTEKSLPSYYTAIADSPRAGHLRAIELLSETIRVCEAVSTEEDDVVADNRELFETLWKHLTFPEHKWSQTRVSGLSGSDLIAARNLARALDHAGSLPKALGLEELKGLRVALEKLRQEIGSISEIPDNLRNYLFYLIARCFSILDGDDVDLTTLRSLSFEIVGAATLAADSVPEERRKNIVDALRAIFRTWGRDIFTGTTSNVLGSGITGLLGF